MMLTKTRQSKVTFFRLTALALLVVAAITLLVACGGGGGGGGGGGSGDGGGDGGGGGGGGGGDVGNVPEMTLMPMVDTITTRPPNAGTQDIRLRGNNEYQNMVIPVSDVPEFSGVAPTGRLYIATSTDDDVAVATMASDDVVEVTAKKRGSAVITITVNGTAATTSTLERSVSTPATPQNISASYAFTVEVENRVPTVANPIPDQTVNQGGVYTLQFADNAFEDPDGDSLSYSVEQSDGSWLTFDEATRTFSGTPDGTGNDITVTVTADDNYGGEVTDEFTIRVNRLPTTGDSIADVTLTVGYPAETINVAANFNDPDGGGLSYTVSSDDSNIATAAVSGSVVTVTPVAAGSTDITVTAVEPDGLSVAQTFKATVAANQAPTAVGTIAAVTLTAGGSAEIIDVGAYFNDPEGGVLTYTVSSDAPDIATASVSGSVVTVTPVAVGDAFMVVTAEDPAGLREISLLEVMVVEVKIVNVAPTPDLIISASSVSNPSPETNASFTFSATVRNQGTGASVATALSYYLSSDSIISPFDTVIGADSVSSLATSENSLESILLTAPSSSGTYYYGACVDFVHNEANTNNNCSTGVMVTVTAPVTTTVPDLIISSRSVSDSTLTTDAPFTLRATVYNQGTGSSAATTLRYYLSSDSTITTTDTEVGTYSVSTLLAAYVFSPQPITLTAPSSSGTYYYGACVDTVPNETNTDNNCSKGLRATVTSAANQPPTAVGTIPAVALAVGDLAVTRDVLSYFNDPEGGVLTYTVSSSTPGIATADVSGSVVTVTPVAAGSTTITVTAEDLNGLSATQSIAVTVTAANQAPTAIGTIAAVTLSERDLAVTRNVLSYFNDPEGGVLTYTVSSSAPGVATVGVSGSVVTVTPVAAGSATITVTAEDLNGLSATQSIAVTVTAANQAPTAIGTIAAVTLSEGDLAVTRDVLSYFNDPESGVLTYTVSSSAPGVATASVSGSIVTVTPVVAGSATITVTVQDPGGLSATQNISVTVAANQVPTTPPSDLVVSDIDIQFRPASRRDIRLYATVHNQGTGPSAATNLIYYRSSDSTISNEDTQVSTDPIPLLVSSAISSRSASLTSPSEEGTYYYGACVDSVPYETDTNNNCSTGIRYTVTGHPDLVVSAIYVSARRSSATISSVTTYEYFDLRTTVRNQGTRPSASTTLRYYLSSDPTISNGDTQVGIDSVSSIADSTTSFSQSISLKAPGLRGIYYYGACLDSLLIEADTDNNCSTGVRLGVDNPDLVVSTDVSSSDSTLTKSQSFRLEATVRNRGDGASARATLRYYLSSDPTISSSDTQVGTDRVSVGASETDDEYIDLTAPSVPGTYFYGACVDYVSTEIDTDNNCSIGDRVTVTGTGTVRGNPDLVISTISVDRSTLKISRDLSFDLDTTIRNQGTGEAADITLRYYRSSDSTISTGDTPVGTDRVRDLWDSETGEESIGLDAPSEEGVYYYGACVASVRYETNTNNNCSTGVRVTVLGEPDLVVSTISVSDSTLTTSQSFRLNATVGNQGDGASTPTTLNYYLSPDSTLSYSDTLGFDLVDILSASATAEEFIDLTAPSQTGTYYYFACVRSLSIETDRHNNCSTGERVTVTGAGTGKPDLIPTILHESTITAGMTYENLGASVVNHGAGVSASTTVRYYLSSDSTISTSDTQIGTVSVDALGIYQSVWTTIESVAPSVAGTYYYGVCVDSVPNEADTNNNCSAVLVTVVANQAPTLTRDWSSSEGTIDTVILIAGDSAFTSDVSSRFYDPDYDSDHDQENRLTYTVSSSAPRIATAGINGSIVTVTPVEAGSSTITVTAHDLAGLIGTKNIAVTVNPAAPDLFVLAVSVRDDLPLTAGERFGLEVAVRNRGTGASIETNLGYYLSTDSTISTGDDLVGTDRIRFDVNSATDEDSISNLIAPSNAGTYYYGVCVDSVPNETNTSNNCSIGIRVTVTGTVPVPDPDLIVDISSVSNLRPETNASFTFQATVRNQGAGASASTTLRYYRSTDQTISRHDTQIGTYSVNSLPASGTFARFVSLTAPSSAGTYYYGVCVDAVSNESNTNNNCSTTVVVTVTDAPTPIPTPTPTPIPTPTPTPTPTNQPPTAVGTVSDVLLTMGGPAVAGDVASYFNDPENGVLTYTVSSSTPSVATASINGSVVTIRTVAVGSTTITVTAQDSGGLSATQDIAVTVAANQAPRAVGTIDSITLSVGDSAATIYVAPNFNDPANGVFTYTVSSSARSVATADINGSTVTISPAAIGSATITVTALNFNGQSATQDIEVTVTAANQAPRAVGTIGAVTMIVAAPGESSGFSRDVASYFSDPENGSLYYTVSSSTPSVATASINRSVVTIRAVAVGSTTITVTAHDPGGLSATQDIAVTVSLDSVVEISQPVSGSPEEPDLYIDQIRFDNSMVTSSNNRFLLEPNQGFKLYPMVRNKGTSNAEGTRSLDSLGVKGIFVRAYKSSDSSGRQRTQVGRSFIIGSIDVGETVRQTISLNAPESSGEEAYYHVCVDSVPNEADTGNNCPIQTIKVTAQAPPPRLTITASVADDTLRRVFDDFKLKATVKNEGKGRSESTILRYYFGSTVVDTKDVDALNPGSKTSEKSKALRPPPIEGRYEYKVCVDGYTCATVTVMRECSLFHFSCHASRLIPNTNFGRRQ